MNKWSYVEGSVFQPLTSNNDAQCGNYNLSTGMRKKLIKLHVAAELYM